MGSHITLWGRHGDADSAMALRWLRDQGLDADRILDVDRQPPTPSERQRIESGAGRLLSEPLPVPLLLTPKGALVGFRERRWALFFEIG